jgi:hypothetical protein
MAYTLRVSHPDASGGIYEREGVAGTGTGPMTFPVELVIGAGELGVMGWDLGLAHDPSLLTLDSATLSGTASESASFTSLEVVSGGVVCSAVLSDDGTTLLPPDSTSVLLLATYQAVFPVKDTTVQTRLRLVDGLTGQAGPVTTRVRAWDGTAEVPGAFDRSNLIVLLSGFEYSPLFDISLETAGSVAEGEGRVLRGFIPPGTHPGYLVRVFLESRLPASATSGAQGWSLSIAQDETALRAGGITLEGTDAGRLIQGGFERHELVDNASGRGLVSAIVLSFSQPISLPSRGRSELLRATYTVQGDTSVLGERLSQALCFCDKLQGQGQPVNNVVTYLGESNRPLVRKGLRFELEVGIAPQQPFLRSDPNNDGRVNIADAVWLASELFSQGPPTACFYAADANGDGAKDISDVAFVILYQFLGGRAPPAPHPDCGVLATQDATLCPIGSTACGG